MSDTSLNRREAMRMIGATFMGAATLGGYTYFATDIYQKQMAEAEIDAALNEHPSKHINRDELLDSSKETRNSISQGYGKVGAALGALIGTEHYDWDMPDLFKPQPD